jgi:hypothetical protein
MSEHIQPAHDRRDAVPAPPEEHERTPGVLHESEAFAFGLVIKVGIGLAVFIAIVQVVLVGLLGGFEKQHTVPPERISELTREDTARPLNQRVDKVPAPHLEGIERQSSLLEIRTEDGAKQRFVTSADVRVRAGKNDKARLFELRDGQRVTISYYVPGGDGGGIGVVTSVTSPPMKAEQKKAEAELPDASRTLNGEIIRIEPRSIAAARDWAKVQMEHYGWIDRKKEIVHIPVEKAMEEVLRSKELGPTSRQRKRPENAGEKR